ncbi:formylglycine-generating enzyme family protein [Zavarzinella formosa]|uniref:formylglycine-generating enzyme family protein n=1 Tax=Zavarzinella formosa TaxID=360055 RepID=UPI000318D587|nr:formylglycine-generating enzyme family protein [Zavarzinella formosa]
MKQILSIIPLLVLAGCQKSDTVADRPPGDAPPGMVFVPGGKFQMGSDADPKKNAPLHPVYVSGFYMDRTEVTNAEFQKFVDATGFKTVAEKTPTEQDFGGKPVPPGAKPFSVCFKQLTGDVLLQGPWDGKPSPPWWVIVAGADWRHPEGPGSDISKRMDHPVIHVAWPDAVAYCDWAGKRLPTEAEWEWAARGGLDRNEYCWGNQRQGTDGKWYANNFQGKFPTQNDALDGFTGTAPVASYPANGYGLHDMSGNAWEWCSDWYDPEYYIISPMENPKGPDQPTGERVRRGGSFLCDDSYCRRYLPEARDHNPPSDAASHTGFRCVKDLK